MKTILHMTIIIAVAGMAWIAGSASRDMVITVSGSCPAAEAYEPPADLGFAEPGSDAVSLEWLPDQGEA